jgi:hypothetical protein
VISYLRRPHHTIRKVLRKEYSDVATEKCYEIQNLFLANKELNWHIMLKEIVSTL